MRSEIEAKELKQFKEAIKSAYNSMNLPKITLVFVNKRIN